MKKHEARITKDGGADLATSRPQDLPTSRPPDLPTSRPPAGQALVVCGERFATDRDLLSVAAARVSELDARARHAAREAVACALAAGAFLLAVKSRLPHGGFLLWLSQNCGSVSHKTATKYMRLAEMAAEEVTIDMGDDGRPLPATVGDKSLTQLYEDYGIVRKEASDNWGGDRRDKAAQNGKRVGRRPKGSPEEVEAALDAAANYEPAMWASAEGAIGTVVELDEKKQLFSRLEDGHLAMAAQLLGDLARKAGEALKKRLAQRGMGLHDEGMDIGDVVEILKGGL